MDTKKLTTVIADAGFEPKSYSGRGMYGKSCVGINVENPIEAIIDIVETAWDSYNDDDDSEGFRKFLNEIKEARTDSLGTGYIMYWPKAEWDANEERTKGESVLIKRVNYLGD